MHTIMKAGIMAAGIALCGAPTIAQDQSTPRQITVVGNGSISTTPDIMRVTLVVMAEAPEASDAIRQMSAQLEEVMRALGAAGLSSRDIQTTGLRLSQRHTAKLDINDRPELAGFTASSDVTIVVRNIAQSGGILDAVVDAGANHINSLQFDVSERGALLEQARNAAVADAVSKTALYADAANVATGVILAIEETSAGGGFPRAMQGMAARDVPIAAGAFEVSAQVTLTTAVE